MFKRSVMRSPVKACDLFYPFCIFGLFISVSAHIRLMYPFPRKYAIDSLNNRINPYGDCGMPRGSVNTEILMGSSFTVTWAVGQPHDGGHRVELLDKEYNLLATLVPSNGTADEFYGNNTVANMARVTLPADISCPHCILRVIKQGEMTPDHGSPFSYVYRSCADIEIADKVSTRKAKCSHRGVWNGTACRCNKPFLGNFCEFEEECFDDSDCANAGICIDTHAQFFLRRQCYCPRGWLGPRCATMSAHNIVTFNSSLYRKLAAPYAVFTLYWRVIKVTHEVEFVVHAKTKNWLAVGWRPDDIDVSCRKFPPMDKENVISLNDTNGRLTVKTVDYLGTEFAKVPLHPMSCTDVVYANAYGNLCRLRDMYIRDFHTPVLDETFGGQQSLTAGQCSEDDGTGYIQAMFRRKLIVIWLQPVIRLIIR
ncbi:uncharacterized protein LOC129585021 isoform X2 [Paramacrobiotus metropolitanus]|uniref:uncharacterized protein LOC129585021 isoform X2 n=1 Tax=Paramacrobiotus metropolitanus TaxID=2943436 RepID=UPI0024463836|nr:uncharacterized protein LOC129585021 isoform X2 [Paramacrobiotus metropolitanus]